MERFSENLHLTYIRTKMRRRYFKISALLLLSSLVFIAACTDNDTIAGATATSPQNTLNKDEAIALATQALPKDIVQKASIIALPEDEGDRWHVTFSDISVTQADLGWKGDTAVFLPIDIDMYLKRITTRPVHLDQKHLLNGIVSLPPLAFNIFICGIRLNNSQPFRHPIKAEIEVPDM